MNVLDLFSGIGGFSLGLERAGMRTVAFCECEPYCRAVLAKHWPGIPCYPDVRELTASRLAADGIGVDVICGGFPCQDISFAGKGAGLAGARSGLWSEYSRLIGELGPRWVVVENVSALLSRGLDTVLGDLAAIGYDAEWHCIPASYVGAPHRRDRVWIIAHPGDGGQREPLQPLGQRRSGAETDARSDGEARALADTERPEWRPQRETCGTGGSEFLPRRQEGAVRAGGCGSDVADTSSIGLQGQRDGGGSGSPQDHEARGETTGAGGEVRHAADDAQDRHGIRRGVSAGEWRTEPDVGRVAHGVPSRVDRLRALGNAVVPQIPEIIGRAIMKSFSVNQRPEQ